MSNRILSCTRLPRSLLAANIALVFACVLPASADSISSPRALAQSAIATPSLTAAGQVFVQNCSDHDPGSLREAFANAGDGTIIDLTHLQCGTITLTTGEIGDSFAANNVTIIGSGQTIATDIMQTEGRVIHHYGQGTLNLYSLVIANGKPHSDNPYGGCIFSKGHVYLHDSTVTNCNAIREDTKNDPKAAYGGAIWAYGIVTLHNSVVSHSTVSSLYGQANGGGIWAHGVKLYGGTVSFNQALGNKNHHSQGGGIFTSRAAVTPQGYPNAEFETHFSTITLNNADEGGGVACDDMNVRYSAITFNGANFSGGGILAGINPGTGYENRSFLNNSTISENTSGIGGGITIDAGNYFVMLSSTVFHNHANAGAGLYVHGNPVLLGNNIIAGNVLFGGGVGGADIGGYGSIIGSHNIINHSIPNALSDNIDADPMLGPLQYNGGVTETLALLPGSFAIDNGLDPTGFSWDQRGPGFPRKVGTKTDIGAFEYNDAIFANGFDPN